MMDVMVVVVEKCRGYMHLHLGMGSDYLCREGTDGVVAAVVVVVVALALSDCYDCKIAVARVVEEGKCHSYYGGIDHDAGNDYDDKVANDVLSVLMWIR